MPLRATERVTDERYGVSGACVCACKALLLDVGAIKARAISGIGKQNPGFVTRGDGLQGDLGG